MLPQKVGILQLEIRKPSKNHQISKISDFKNVIEIFSSKKIVFEKNDLFYFIIILHSQSLKVSLHNSHSSTFWQGKRAKIHWIFTKVQFFHRGLRNYDDGDDWLLDFVDLEPSYRVADTSLALLPSSRSLSNFASACASISCGDPHGQLLAKTFQKNKCLIFLRTPNFWSGSGATGVRVVTTNEKLKFFEKI